MPKFTTTGNFSRRTVLATAKPSNIGLVGTRAEFLSGGQWYRGFIADRTDNQVRVRYYGYTEADDEWLDVKMNMRKPTPHRGFAIGKPVQIHWIDQWYPGRILSRKAGLYFVHYDNYGREWNEWVAPDRLR